MTHTPGPWSLTPTQSGRAGIVWRGAEGNNKHQHVEVFPIEDARLIAAAPEMLDALWQVYSMINNGYPGMAMEAIKQIIAKAEGKTSQ